MTVGQKDLNSKLMIRTSHSTSRNRNILRRGRKQEINAAWKLGRKTY